MKCTKEKVQRWIKYQRESYRRGSLSSRRIRLLDNLDGWCWNCIDRKQEAIDKAYVIFQRAKKRGCLPKYNSKDSQEKKDDSWIYYRKQAKSGKGEAVWYTEFDAIAEEYGFPGAFETIYYKQKAVNRCYTIFQRAKKRGCLPRRRSKDLRERRDGGWVSTRRQAKISRNENYIWYPELEKIAEEYGFSGAFDMTDRKQEAIDKAYVIFQRAKKRGCLPKYNSKDSQEKQDRKWIGARRQAKFGSGKNTWYPEFDDIAEEHGFIGVFEKQK